MRHRSGESGNHKSVKAFGYRWHKRMNAQMAEVPDDQEDVRKELNVGRYSVGAVGRGTQ